MEKNNQPFSQPCNARLAIADQLNSLVTVHNRCLFNFKTNCGFMEVPEVPGTLQVSCIQRVASPMVYDVQASMRVAFSSLDNSTELDVFRGQQVILLYTSGGKAQKIAGTKSHPLEVSISEPEGFDGYEITLTGSQNNPESYI